MREGASATSERRRTLALGLIFLTVVIDLIGFGIVLPLLPFYATSMGATSVDVGLIIGSFSAMQFLLAPVWGRLSDRFGRRPILVFGLFGSGASYVLFGLAETVGILLLSRVVAGIMGANIAVAQAYVADTTTLEDRARGMGMIGAAFGLGFVLGPALGGLLSRWGYGVPGFFAAALSLVAATVAWLFLPESLPADVAAASRGGPGRAAGKPATTGVGGAVTNSLRALRDRMVELTDALRVPALRDPIGATLVGSMGFAAFTTTFPLYLEDPLGMSSVDAGWFFAFVGLISASVQGGLVGPAVDRLGEQRVALTGSLLLTLGLGGVAWMRGVPGLLAALAVVGLGWGLMTPSLQSVVSRRAAAGAQGGVLGVNQSAGSLARVVGPVAGGWAFGALGFRWEFLATAATVAVAAVWIHAMAAPEPGEEGALVADRGRSGA